MSNEEIEEGVEFLDPEAKKMHEEEMEKAKIKTDKMREINKNIVESIKELSDDYGLKIIVGAFNTEFEEMGIWKSDNLTTLDEMGFSKLFENQF